MELERPDWDSYFMTLAFVASSRSRDQETKHGTILVDKNNIILGTGYNSFIKGVNDASLPKIRPNKYPFMIHSELNAILNCRVLPREAGGGRAYVTGRCCNHCLQSLIQAGINELIMSNRKGSDLEDEKSLEIFNNIVEQTNVTIRFLKYDLKWLKQIINYYETQTI
jgi:dCMP deaminase